MILFAVNLLHYDFESYIESVLYSARLLADSKMLCGIPVVIVWMGQDQPESNLANRSPDEIYPADSSSDDNNLTEELPDGGPALTVQGVPRLFVYGSDSKHNRLVKSLLSIVQKCAGAQNVPKKQLLASLVPRLAPWDFPAIEGDFQSEFVKF